MKDTTARTALFGPYTLRLRSGELRKFGTKVKMGEQTFQILHLLLETQGELVTREELRARLWAGDTFVDFDHGLNSAIQRLRDCLSDSAENPRWIETVPRRGYRFIGRVEWSDAAIPASETPLDPDFRDRRKPFETTAPPIQDAEAHEEPSLAGVRTRRMALLLIAVLAILVTFLTVKRVRDGRTAKRGVAIHSLAVLPLENLSGDPAQEYFADVMTDEVITMLAKNLRLRVISRTSVMQYKKVLRPLPEIARELGVDGILEGSVGRAGNRVHVTAQLIYAPSDTHVWAESFDRDLSDVAALQNELAETIAKQVGIITTSGSVGPEPHINPEAHDAYMLGRYYWFAEDHQKSREYFQKAIALQPDYAAAWSGLSDSYCASAVVGKFPPAAVMPQAEAAAKKALELNDLSAEAHHSMAAIELFYRWNWAAAERESARAVELNPNFAQGHSLRAYTLRPLNRLNEALQEEKKAMELDPMTRSWALVVALMRLRQFDAALHQAQILSQAQPNDASLHYILSEAYFCKGMEKESEQEAERYLELAGEKDQLTKRVQFYRRGGLRAVLEWNVELLKQRAAKQYVSPTDFVDAYSQLGRKEETIHYLEESYRERSPRLGFMQSEPDLDFLHSDPRYRAIVNKMGLAPVY